VSVGDGYLTKAQLERVLAEPPGTALAEYRERADRMAKDCECAQGVPCVLPPPPPSPYDDLTPERKLGPYYAEQREVGGRPLRFMTASERERAGREWSAQLRAKVAASAAADAERAPSVVLDTYDEPEPWGPR
jgi:hypothetical protein